MKWSQEDIKEISHAGIFLAADVIFDNSATDAFMSCLKSFMDFSVKNGTEAICIIAIERRINFTFDDLDATAPAYNHFMQSVHIGNVVDLTSKDEQRPMFKGFRLQVSEIPKVTRVPE